LFCVWRIAPHSGACGACRTIRDFPQLIGAGFRDPLISASQNRKLAISHTKM
jgi:hypothetical protein